MNKITYTNKQYKTVGVQAVAGVWIPLWQSWRQASPKSQPFHIVNRCTQN